ncbi:uncharacterized protein LOC124818112 [Hydra vulgaris]|uniref:uncharacterized protein LOC124818112 n=1 Tax=Hydra vulgaris TaxID=6087 RepID=UPI001F5EFF74|nr:uncharacterized protein LOC124818112 [Hydra vulgaris]
MDIHCKNLKLLCRVCRNFLGKKHYFIEAVLKVKIETVFHLKLNDLVIVHPSKVCLKCYCTINNKLKRKTSSTILLCDEWQPHCNDCFACQSVVKLSKGASMSKLQVRNKAMFIGRPKKEENISVWTFSMFNTLKESIITIHND